MILSYFTTSTIREKSQGESRSLRRKALFQGGCFSAVLSIHTCAQLAYYVQRNKCIGYTEIFLVKQGHVHPITKTRNCQTT